MLAKLKNESTKMKYVKLLVIFLFFIACNSNIQKDNKINVAESDELLIRDSIGLYDSIVIDDPEEAIKSLKREKLMVLEDDLSQLQELIISKSFYKEEDQYVLDFKYPLLNEHLDPGYKVFNEYINDQYVDVKGTEAQILEDKELLCDTLKTNNYRDKRKVDFKAYQSKDNLLSVLFFKENYYSGAIHSSYIFDCMNFDLENHNFLNYDDFFAENSEEELFTIINQIILEGIETGELYFDCWELSLGDFNEYRNNFVVDDDLLEFYFDDCVICPSYIGTFSVEIPIEIINHLLIRNQI